MDKKGTIRRLLLRGAIASFAVKIIGTGIAFIAQILLASWLGVVSYGNYVYVFTWLNLLVIPAKWGFDIASLRFVATYCANGEWGALKGFFRYSWHRTIAISTVIAISLFLGVRSLCHVLGLELYQTFAIASLILPFFAIVHLAQRQLQGLQKVVRSPIPHDVLIPAIVLGGAAILAQSSSVPLDARAIAILHLVAMPMALGVLLWWIAKALPPPVRTATRQNYDREWNETARSTMLVMGFGLMLSQMDTIMLGLLVGTTEAGLYFAASRLSKLLIFFLAAVDVVQSPLAAKLHARGDRAELQKTVSLGACAVFYISLASGIFLTICGRWFLHLFGVEFIASYPILVVLIVGQLINALTGSVEPLLYVTGYHRDTARVLGASAIVNLALNGILIPHYGAMGAAIATTITLFLSNVALSVFVWYRLRIVALAFPINMIQSNHRDG